MEELYPFVESEDEITSDVDDRDHLMTMYSTEEEDNSDYDSQYGPSSPGWLGMTSVQRGNLSCSDSKGVKRQMRGRCYGHDDARQQ